MNFTILSRNKLFDLSQFPESSTRRVVFQQDKVSNRNTSFVTPLRSDLRSFFQLD